MLHRRKFQRYKKSKNLWLNSDYAATKAKRHHYKHGPVGFSRDYIVYSMHNYLSKQHARNFGRHCDVTNLPDYRTATVSDVLNRREINCNEQFVHRLLAM